MSARMLVAGFATAVVVAAPSNAVARSPYTAYEIPVYSCISGPVTPAGTNVANVEYIDKGSDDIHLEDVQALAIPDIANWNLTEKLDGAPFITFTESSLGTFPPIELKGSDVPPITSSPPVVDVIENTSPPFNLIPGIKIASSTCAPA